MLRLVRQIPVVIDRASPVPLYHQLAVQLTATIENGTLRPGDSVENELALAERLDLSRPTVRRAIAELVARGLLVRRRGVGTAVASEVIHRRDELTSLYDDMHRKGRNPVTVVLRLDRRTVDPTAATALDLPADTPLLYMERLRLAGDVPTALMRNWLPPQFNDITAESLTEGSLYAVLRARGARPVVAHQTIGARRPRSVERKRLGLAPGDPLLTMTQRAYDGAGVAIEFGDHCYRFDQYAFDVTVHER
jgi:GntR family transcriptional regulator